MTVLRSTLCTKDKNIKAVAIARSGYRTHVLLYWPKPGTGLSTFKSASSTITSTCNCAQAEAKVQVLGHTKMLEVFCQALSKHKSKHFKISCLAINIQRNQLIFIFKFAIATSF